MVAVFKIGIAEYVRELKATVAQQAFGVDGEPAAWPEVQNIAVMQIAVQDDDVLRFREEFTRRRGRLAQDTAVPQGGRLQFLKPARQRYQFGKRPILRRVQSGRHVADYAARLVGASTQILFRDPRYDPGQ